MYMPILKQETKEIILPISKAKVILIKLNYGIFVKARGFDKEDEEATFKIACGMIEDWDFVDENNKKLPITIENLKKFNKDDGNFLMDRLAEQVEEKKNLK